MCFHNLVEKMKTDRETSKKIYTIIVEPFILTTFTSNKKNVYIRLWSIRFY